MSVWQYYFFNGILRNKILSFCTHSSDRAWNCFSDRSQQYTLNSGCKPAITGLGSYGCKPTIIVESSDKVNLLKSFLFFCPHTP